MTTVKSQSVKLTGEWCNAYACLSRPTACSDSIYMELSIDDTGPGPNSTFGGDLSIDNA